ncbi:MAG: hypothetical protein AAF493_07170 [Pseudomonadota bacterium]
MIDRLPFFLVLTAMILAALLFGAIKFANGGVAPPSAADKTTDAPTEAATRFEITNLDIMSETRDRPLFFENRREPPKAPPVDPNAGVTAPEPETGPSEFKLSAIVIDDDVHTALLTDNTGAVHRVAQGEKIGAWTLKSVTPESVTLVRGRRKQEVLLRTFEVPKPAAEPTRDQRRTQRRRRTNDAADRDRPPPAQPQASARSPEARRERMRARAERREQRRRLAEARTRDGAQAGAGGNGAANEAANGASNAAEPPLTSPPKEGGECGLSRC